MKPKLITAPTTEPVTLAEAKEHCRVDGTDHDAYITALISIARQTVEEKTNLALLSQVWRVYLDAFPAGDDVRIKLVRPPLISVTSVKYYDSQGSLQTLDPSKYQVDDADCPPRIEPAYGEAWPATRAISNAVFVEYTAGYADASAVPGQAVQAIKLLVGTWFENRESVVTGTIVSALPDAIDMLLSQIHVMPS